MRLRTEIKIKTIFPKIDYNSKIMFFGSCFAENVGAKFKNSGFNINLNPFGVIYNPASIQENMQLLINKKYLTEKDLYFSNNLWFSYNHHGKFSNIDKNTCLSIINTSMEYSAEYLKNTDYIFFTFGTAWVYKLIYEDKIVANCHKQPAKIFERYRLSITEIVKSFKNLIDEIKLINKNVKFVFTVSPVRHWKDGANGNQLSKSILLLAIDEIVNNVDDTFYFPAYEIVNDELRDYRFYADDMLHISNVAVEYIWDKFKQSFFSGDTQLLILQIQKLYKASNHRLLNSNSEEYRTFIDNNISKIESIEKQYKISLIELKNKFYAIKKGE